MSGLPLERILLDDLVDIDARLIEFNKRRGLSHTRAVRMPVTPESFLIWRTNSAPGRAEHLRSANRGVPYS